MHGRRRIRRGCGDDDGHCETLKKEEGVGYMREKPIPIFCFLKFYFLISKIHFLFFKIIIYTHVKN